MSAALQTDGMQRNDTCRSIITVCISFHNVNFTSRHLSAFLPFTDCRMIPYSRSGLSKPFIAKLLKKRKKNAQGLSP